MTNSWDRRRKKTGSRVPLTRDDFNALGEHSVSDNERHRHPSPLRGLLVAQFFGAFNDNAWKLMVALLAIKQLASQMGAGPEFEAASQAQTTLTFVVFTLPLMLVSIVAGVFSDRFSKRSVIVVMKGVEVVLMALGTWALYLNPSGGTLPLVVLGGMAVQSALFSPAKYGILPELLPHERLAVGNGQLELWTFLAIIGGTGTGGVLLQMSGSSPWLGGAVLLVFSVMGFVASLMVPAVPRARDEGGVAATLQGAWQAVQTDRVLRLGISGNVGYWTIASLVGQDILVYAKAVLELSDSLSGLPLATFGIGVGLGSVLAGKLSHAKVEVGQIPLGAVGLMLGLLLLGTLSPGLTGTLLAMGWLGFSSGFILVPINALIQWRAPQDRRGAVISFGNIFVFGGIVVGSLGAGALSLLGLNAGEILVIAGMAAAALTAWAAWLMPETFLRMVLFLVTHTLYRLRVVGREHVPERGGSLLLPNHVSFVDGLLLLASIDRPIRFLVDRYYYELPFLHRAARTMGAIPVSAGGSPREILHALREAGRRLDDGEVVCVFPEGQITRTGGLLSFRQGFERIVKGREVPVIPVHLDRIWGSIFSFIGGKFLLKRPERVPYPVTVSYGEPMPSTVTASEVRQRVQELGEEAWRSRKSDRRPLQHSFVRAARRHPLRFAFADATRPKVSCLESLAGAVALARALRPHWMNQHTVGILLPPSVGGAVVNLAATLSGRTVVNLNYTVGRSGIESMAGQAGLETIVTSRMFLEKANLEMPEGVKLIWIEEIRKTIGTAERVKAFAMALVAPIGLLEKGVGAIHRPQPDDLATIIFSSGSTGEPKGVMLSHFNIDANVEAVMQVFHTGPKDRILGILPFFHSFGYLATLWLSVNHGVGVVYHPTPLDAGAIGELIEKKRVTILISTPTFLQLYWRRCLPEQFGSVRVVLTGAEKLSERLAGAFEEKFGIRPLEGYGVTECAPVIAVNCPDFRAAGFFQPASRRGTVGRSLPGVSVRIVDPESFAPVPIGTSGMLIVKGPNVMQGYLNRPDLTAEAMHDGWYVTGDIAVLDEDGFLTITDRLSRFAKIGGEMVPHGKVEDALHEATDSDVQVFAVTSIPDEKKGEQLAVLHTLDEAIIPGLLEKVAASGLPNLFIPRKDAFVRVDQLPVLGTGKLDLRALKRVALERLSAG
ncbi:MAG: acyl-[ACP]--phospholipid O-acyltransferase [Nitrospira sp.]|nr:acyl-[ACP]--phospholipid O-acyltransferase [Nitrospira sp.]